MHDLPSSGAGVQDELCLSRSRVALGVSHNLLVRAYHGWIELGDWVGARLDVVVCVSLA